MTTWLPFDPPRQAPPLLTQDEACCLLRIEATHQWKALAVLRKQGLRAVSISGRIRFPLAETLNFIERQLQENPR